MSTAATLNKYVDQQREVIRDRSKTYADTLSADARALGNAWLRRVVWAVAAFVLLTCTLMVAGVSVLLATSLDSVDVDTSPALWAVPLVFLLATVVFGVMAWAQSPPKPLTLTRRQLHNDALRAEQAATELATSIDERVAPARQLADDLKRWGVLHTVKAAASTRASAWWQRQPARPTVEGVQKNVHEALAPMAQQHPWVLVGVAAALGGLVAAALPPAWIRQGSVLARRAWRTSVATAAPAAIGSLLAGSNLSDIASAFMKAVQSGLEPRHAATRAGDAPSRPVPQAPDTGHL